MPLWMSTGYRDAFWVGGGLVEEQWIELSGDVSLEAAQCRSFRFPFRDPSLQVGLGVGVPAQTGDRDAVDGGVGSPIAAAAESSPAGVPRRRLDRTDTAQRRERGL